MNLHGRLQLVLHPDDVERPHESAGDSHGRGGQIFVGGRSDEDLSGCQSLIRVALDEELHQIEAIGYRGGSLAVFELAVGSHIEYRAVGFLKPAVGMEKLFERIFNYFDHATALSERSAASCEMAEMPCSEGWVVR